MEPALADRPPSLATRALVERLQSPSASVPVLPALAQQVIALASAPDTPVWRIAGIVSKDQVLAARLLGLANTAYCSPLQPVGTVSEAIVRLGTAAVRNLVVTVCFTSRLHDPKVYGSRGRDFIDHGLGTAYLARLVAERAGQGTDAAFLYGLLHDIGKLVVLKTAHDLVRQGQPAVPPDELDAVMADLHAHAGGAALRRWQLPEELCTPVEWHHAPAEAPEPTARVAYLANRLSHRYGFGCAAVTDPPLLDEPFARELGLDEAWLCDVDQRAPALFEIARSILA
ncbi:MAG: HDOD domain-containing protein [Vicinamibacterales bacterium]